MWLRAGPGTQHAWERANKILKQSGAEVVDVDLPEVFGNCHSWRDTIVAGEARAAFLPRKS